MSKSEKKKIKKIGEVGGNPTSSLLAGFKWLREGRQGQAGPRSTLRWRSAVRMQVEGQIGGSRHPSCIPLPGSPSPLRLPTPALGRGRALAPARPLLALPPSLPSPHTSFLQTQPT